jgi:protein O-GlcNAc transferase
LAKIGAIDRDFRSALSAFQSGNLKDAERLFAAVLRAKPKHVGALNLMGVVLTQLDRFAEAENFFRQALQEQPRSDATLYNYGLVLKAQNRPAEALACFDEALHINPLVAETWNNRGTVFNDLKRYEEAVSDFNKAISLNPRYAEAFCNKGKTLLALKKINDAFAAYDQAIALSPGLAQAWLGRGNACLRLKDYSSAFTAYDRVVALGPDLAEGWLGRGYVLAEIDRFDEALVAYDRAITRKANFPEALYGRGDVFVQLQQYEKAIAAYDAALMCKPDLSYAKGDRLYAKLCLCDWHNLDAELCDLVSAVRAGRAAVSPFQFLAMAPAPADQLQCVQTFMEDQPRFPPVWGGEIYRHDRIRVGYFSGDLRRHPVAQLAAGLFEHHDKSRFEITAISYGPDDGSDLRNRIKSAAENFVDVGAMADEAVAEFIRRREIDILVDLTGLTQNNRFSVVSRRAAPIQVNFLGYPGTMGADCMDYIIADPTIIPEDHFPYYSERVVWLPDSYQANDRKRRIAERRPTRNECDLPEAAFVFCCFNNAYKIMPEIFAVWLNLLAAREDSVLWLIKTNATAQANFRREIERRGIASERLIFAPTMPLPDHLARMTLADLYLDTLPYNAHTGASDALWAGLPVLTCLGATFACRVAASLLRAVGLPELITTALDEYEALGLRLASDPALLASIKAKLARNRDTHALFDTARFTRHIEAAYTTMWQRQQRGQPPAAFAVERIQADRIHREAVSGEPEQ